LPDPSGADAARFQGCRNLWRTANADRKLTSLDPYPDQCPLKGFGKNDKVLLVFYALPNGNSIEQTVGKNLKEGDDWHYNIQHIRDSISLPIRRLNIPTRNPDAETGSAFMKRIASLPLTDREEEIFHAISSGNVPDFLRNTVTLMGEFADSAGTLHRVIYEAMPDYLAVGSNLDYCRIPMNPYTAQNLAYQFGASLITAKLSDHIYQQADIKLTPFNYIPVGNANELVSKFEEHNARIEKQLRESGGKPGQLVAGIKKDIVLTSRNAAQPGKVVLYGWHKPDGKPIQPVYSGHIYWYVDYSHGIRLINNQVLIDWKRCLFTDILKDPLRYKIFSDESKPMETVVYRRKL